MAGNCSQLEIEDLVERFQGDVFRYCRWLAGNDADAEDLAQQTFLLALQKLDQLRQPEKARGWLLAIARNAFLKKIKRTKPADFSTLPGRIEDELCYEIPVTEFTVDEVQQAIAVLPDEFRIAVLMYYFEFLSYKEIAASLDLPLGTVMSRLSRGKKILREQLSSAAAPPDSSQKANSTQTANGIAPPHLTKDHTTPSGRKSGK